MFMRKLRLCGASLHVVEITFLPHLHAVMFITHCEANRFYTRMHITVPSGQLEPREPNELLPKIAGLTACTAPLWARITGAMGASISAK
jgi:hypothetical protein